jgi:peptidylprolyl isomerase
MKRALWFLSITLALGFAGCSNVDGEKTANDTGKGSETNTSKKTEPEKPEVKLSAEDAEKQASKDLKITDTKVGTGQPAEKGDLILVQYRGTTPDGKEFDGNMGSDKDPYALTIGAGGVIKGWDLGLPGIKQGGDRKLVIPYQLAYGEAGRGDKIPPRTNLTFEIKALYIVKQGHENEILSEDVKVGTGKPAKSGDRITVDYTGTLVSGKKFDSSKDRGEPYGFALGEGGVIKGWDAGLVGMKVGGIRKLTVPPEMAYGARGQGAITANQVLKFEVELLKIEPGNKK